MIRIIASMMLCVLVFSTGCGHGLDYTTKVTGTVTVNGKPANGFYVVFNPPKGRPANGTTDSQGRFSLSTFDPGDGAVLGEHVVTITDAFPQGPPPMGRITANMSRVPPIYSAVSTTPLKATVKDDETNDFTFDLKQ
ncbi:MAG: hypothetical protein JXM70_13165 [Pirellulales bacterium]|nr:hypothetical protein [Pirellulales bacterium]